jgi:hypothetical protein
VQLTAPFRGVVPLANSARPTRGIMTDAVSLMNFPPPRNRAAGTTLVKIKISSFLVDGVLIYRAGIRRIRQRVFSLTRAMYRALIACHVNDHFRRGRSEWRVLSSVVSLLGCKHQYAIAIAIATQRCTDTPVASSRSPLRTRRSARGKRARGRSDRRNIELLRKLIVLRVYYYARRPSESPPARRDSCVPPHFRDSARGHRKPAPVSRC